MPSINPVENYNFGVFGLNDVRTSIVTATPTVVGVATGSDTRRIVDIENWSQDSSHGWFGGGYAPGPSPFSTVDRIDFSNDSSTASVRGPLSSVKLNFAATGNSNYGWFGGGLSNVPLAVVSTVDRIDFSNDSSTASVRGPLSLEKQRLVATGNSNYGWFGSGLIPGNINLSTVDRIDFSNDSATVSVRGPLSLAIRQSSATGNSNYGWFGGGLNPSDINISTVNRIDFSNDSSTASVRGPLSSVRYSSAATGNSNYGWFGGGLSNVPIISFSTVDRIDFSNDSATASVRGLLSAARFALAATGNSNYGWFGGGNPTVSRVDRIDFSNDSSTASVRGPLSSAKNQLGATSGQAKGPSIKPLKGGNFGWFGGGQGTSSRVVRADFSNDLSTASIRGPLSAGRYLPAATGNSNYGWFGGGSIAGPALSSIVDRIDFSNDSSLALIRGSLFTARQSLRATGNSNYGWFGGGTPATVSRVDRINFSNDSSRASVRGPLSSVRYSMGATGNSNYGWFGGGATPAIVSRVDRINFSNDSSTASIRGPLSLVIYDVAATGNSNYGWFGGGSVSITPLTLTSVVNRIDFSNDSSTASVRGPLSTARQKASATGNSNYGWFGGGFTPVFTIMDRIDFSNDSTVASFRGILTSTWGLAATSNTPVG